MTEARTERWKASDDVELAWHEVGGGRPVILLHGLFSSAEMNWIKFGHADRIAREGFRVIMPDLRAHGASGKPHDAAAFPPGILARDLKEFVAHLGLSEYDLGGFSLGARTTVQGVGEGLRPRRAVLGGMGLSGLQRWAKRQHFFLKAIEMFDTAPRGDPHWIAIQFMRSMKVDRIAMPLLLKTFEDTPAQWLEGFTMPTLIVCGSEDEDNGPAQELAEALPQGRHAAVPGTHMSSVTEAAFGEEIARFLAA